MPLLVTICSSLRMRIRRSFNVVRGNENLEVCPHATLKPVRVGVDGLTNTPAVNSVVNDFCPTIDIVRQSVGIGRFRRRIGIANWLIASHLAPRSINWRGWRKVFINKSGRVNSRDWVVACVKIGQEFRKGVGREPSSFPRRKRPLTRRIVAGELVSIISLAPDVLKGIDGIAGVLGDFAEGVVGVRVGDVLVIVGQREGRTLGIEVVLAYDPAAVLADQVAVQTGLGGVLGNQVAVVIALLNDVVLIGIPEIVNAHGSTS